MALGNMSHNESRGLLGLEPVENSGKRLRSNNYVDEIKANEYQVGKDDFNEGDDKC